MLKMKNADKIGKYAFLIGLVIAVVLGFASQTTYASTLMMLLVVLGLVVGYLNISDKESTKFLVAVIVLVVGGVAALQAITVLDMVMEKVVAIITYFITFASAAGLVVAIRSVLTSAK